MTIQDRFDHIVNSGLMRAANAYPPDERVALALCILDGMRLTVEEMDFIQALVTDKRRRQAFRQKELPCSYNDCDTPEEEVAKRNSDQAIVEALYSLAPKFGQKGFTILLRAEDFIPEAKGTA